MEAVAPRAPQKPNQPLIPSRITLGVDGFGDLLSPILVRTRIGDGNVEGAQ